MAEFSNWNLVQIKSEIITAQRECSQRGLLQSSKWFAELLYSLDQINSAEVLPKSEETDIFMQEYDKYALAKSYFDMREYDRSAHFTQNCSSSKAYFLHIYARYMAREKRKLDDMTDSIGSQDNTSNEHLKELRLELHKKHRTSELDGYCLYLYGVVLKKLELLQEAVDVFMESIRKQPLHWGAWQELAILVADKEMLLGLPLPDHWMKQFFLAHTYLELQLNEDAIKLYQSLSEVGFSKNTYIMAQIALAYHNVRDVDLAIESFANLLKIDPCRLDNMDTYSNLLFVKEMRADLAYLAHRCVDIDKYTVETCCVIANYYGLRGQHEKAVLYFQRALKLNPNYLSAFTLMGHEYMELKNTSAAIQAYRQAIEVNRRDYRAWYGLGQTYEILKMYSYCLYYYRQAHVLRPNDSRMVVAMGEAYEKLDRLQEAKKCFWKAHSLGDAEGLAITKLAKLYEYLREEDQAAAAYTEYINESEKQGLYNSEEQSQAFKYLANYHLKRGHLDTAFIAAQKCTEYIETREEGKRLLQEITKKRKERGPGSTSGQGEPSNSDGEQPPPNFPGGQSTPLLRFMPSTLSFTP